MSVYDHKPDRFLAPIAVPEGPKAAEVYCVGFELGEWRSAQFAFHLAEWLPEYALPEDELRLHHGNMLVKLNQAAIRVYTSAKYKNRGEAGEIALHAVCRDFFETVPLSPRVFYKSSSNDVVKAFDMVHVRFPKPDELEIWLGESKLYDKASDAIGEALASVKAHLDAGFLQNQKLLLGPQIPKSMPQYEKIISLFKKSASLDKLLSSAVFVIGIACNSPAAAAAKVADPVYATSLKGELEYLATRISKAKLGVNLRFLLVYIPLASKSDLVDAFDTRLKGLQ